MNSVDLKTKPHPLNDLIGKTLASVEREGDVALIFTSTCGRRWKLFHSQDCCESVYIEDLNGDLEDLVGSPILVAEEVSNWADAARLIDPSIAEREKEEESCTWTFYKFDTAKGGITVRWFGSSNGYYSESVDFDEIDADGDRLYLH